MNIHFYEGSYIKFDIESAKSHIGDDEKSSKLATTVHQAFIIVSSTSP